MKSTKTGGLHRHLIWAEFRFAVIGHLLASPPEKGELLVCLKDLAARSWRHPITGESVQIGRSTVERWYYSAIHASNPVDALRRKVRSDAGVMVAVDDKVAELIVELYKEHPCWSAQLITDNLVIEVRVRAPQSKMPSYSSIKRFLKKHGLFRKRKSRSDRRPAAIEAFERCQRQETRLFEALYPHSLWHLDFHKCSRQIVEPDGTWHTPLCLCILDDHTRLVCHIQWYLAEDAECLVHGYSQAVQKRGVAGETMSDNGAAMKSEEFTSGLKRIGSIWSPTLDYSPEQNGKQEAFWGQTEGRLVAMLDSVERLTLKLLNDATIAWAEIEYNRSVHSETHMSPFARLINGRDVSRPSPTTEALKDAFCVEVTRKQLHTDGTIKLENQRFEIPSRYRNLDELTIRYPSWDLSWVYIVNPATGKKLTHIYPVNYHQNATSGRRAIETDIWPKMEIYRKNGEIAPLLKELMAEYAATGLPPAYIPKTSIQETEE